MITVKGPIKIGKNNPIPQKIIEKVRLPFKADNWKSTQNQELIEKTDSTLQIESSNETEDLSPQSHEPPIVEEETAHKFTKKELQEKDFIELKEIAKEFGETGRSKSGLIKDILRAQEK